MNTVHVVKALKAVVSKSLPTKLLRKSVSPLALRPACKRGFTSALPETVRVATHIIPTRGKSRHIYIILVLNEGARVKCRT